jgi:hypothetical protein
MFVGKQSFFNVFSRPACPYLFIRRGIICLFQFGEKQSFEIVEKQSFFIWRKAELVYL